MNAEVDAGDVVTDDRLKAAEQFIEEEEGATSRFVAGKIRKISSSTKPTCTGRSTCVRTIDAAAYR